MRPTSHFVCTGLHGMVICDGGRSGFQCTETVKYLRHRQRLRESIHELTEATTLPYKGKDPKAMLQPCVLAYRFFFVCQTMHRQYHGASP